MSAAQIARSHMPRARSVLLAAFVVVAAMWVWVDVRPGPWGRGEDWRDPVMMLVGVTGIVVAIVLRSLSARPVHDPVAQRWALGAIVVGSALLWSWFLESGNEVDPATWSYGVLVAGVALVAVGSVAWRSLQALSVMLAASWTVVAAVCLKLVFWDGPRFNGPVCSGTIECVGDGLPADNAALLAFFFLPLMVVPIFCQFMAVLMGEISRPVKPTRPGILGRE